MSLRSFFQRLRSGQPDDDPNEPEHWGPTIERWPSTVLVDANTRTFWARGETSASTMVETDVDLIGRSPKSERVAELIAAHERGETASDVPRGNPAYAEAVFVELMRAQQYQRAFALLAPECQRRWGSAETFASAHAGGAMSHLLGVDVLAVRSLPEWVDPATGMAHDHVAELDVEYAVGIGENKTSMERTVHLVPHDGEWRSLSYPLQPAR